MQLTEKLLKKLSVIEKVVARCVRQTRQDLIDSTILNDLPRVKDCYLNSMDRHIKEENQHSGVLGAISSRDLGKTSYAPAEVPPMLKASDGRIGALSQIPLRWRFCLMASLEKEAEHFYRSLSFSTTAYSFNALSRIADQEAGHSQYLLSMHRYLYPRTWWITWCIARCISSVGVAVLKQFPWR